MKRTFNWTLAGGQQGRLVANYSCDMHMLSQLVDGATVLAGYEPVAEQSSMVAYVDGEVFDACYEPSGWRLTDYAETPQTGYHKISGMQIALSPEHAALYEAWLAELMSAGETAAVKAYRAEQEGADHGQ